MVNPSFTGTNAFTVTVPINTTITNFLSDLCDDRRHGQITTLAAYVLISSRSEWPRRLASQLCRSKHRADQLGLGQHR